MNASSGAWMPALSSDFTPVTLAAEVTSRENAITWMPLPPTQKWLNERLLQMFTEMTNQQDPRVLVRLKLAGNFIWGPQRTPKLHLDGEVFGRPADGRVDIGLPSGNGRARRRPRHVVLAVPPGIRSPASGSSQAAPAGSSRPQPAQPRSARKPCNSGSIDQSPISSACCRPAIKSTPRSASVPTMRPASRGERGVQRLVGLVSDRQDRLGRFLSERLQGTLQIPIATEVVPDAQLQERVRAMMANQAGPDFVIGDEALAARLQQLQFHTEFIRL